MPLTPLQQSLDKSNSSFAQRLQQVSGYADAILQSEQRKNQLAEQIQNQRDLIDYRYDRKQKYYEDVTKPQTQKKNQQDQIDQYIKDVKKSGTDSEAAVQSFNKEMRTRYQGLYDYGFAQMFHPQIEPVSKDGQLMGYQTAVYFGNGDNQEKISTDEALNQASRFKTLTDDLNSVKNANVDLKTEKEYDTNGNLKSITVGNDAKGKEFIRQIKTDPETRGVAYNLEREGGITVAKKEPNNNDGGKVRKSTLEQISGVLGNWKNRINKWKNGKLEFTFADDNISSSFSLKDMTGYGAGDEPPKTDIRMKGVSFSDVYAQANNVMKTILPKKYKNFDVSKLSDGEWDVILNGTADDENVKKQLNKLPENRRQIINHLSNLNDQSKSYLQDVKDIVKVEKLIFNAYSSELGRTINEDKYGIDWDNVPDNITKDTNLSKIVIPMDDLNTEDRILQQGKDWEKWHGDAKATNDWINQ